MRARPLGTAVALALALVPALSVTAAAEHALSLDEAVARALRRNEGLRIEREALGASRAASTAARGAYDPVLGLQWDWSRTNEPFNTSFSGAPAGELAPEVEAAGGEASLRQLLPTGGIVSVRARGSRAFSDGTFTPLSPAYGAQAGVELRQPLLRGLAMDGARLSVRVADAGRDAAQAALRRATSETVAAVEQAYWGLVAARLAVEVRDEAMRLAAEQLRETELRAGSGAVPRTELAQPRAELERRRGEALAARETLARAENALRSLILDGADDPLWGEPLVPADPPEPGPDSVDVSAALERAMAARPELEIAAAGLQARRAERRYARSQVWPSLDAVVSYDRFGLTGSADPAAPVPAGLEGDLGDAFDALGDDDLRAARVALVLGLPITDRGARGNSRVARHREAQAEAEIERVRKAIRAEVLDAAAALETAGQRIEAARSGREAAEIQLEAERERYATGLSTNFLVLTRQNDLSRARLDEISARTDHRMARTELARATGWLLRERGIDAGDTGR